MPATINTGIMPTSRDPISILIVALLSSRSSRHTEARELVEQAHQVCPYSNATRGNVDVQLRVVEAA